VRAFGRDLAFAVRALARRPLFTAAAALTLALGLGANAAIFNVIDQVMLRQPPYRDPERLVMLRLSEAGSASPRPLSWSYPDYEDLKSHAVSSPSSQSFQDVAAFAGWTFNLTGTEIPERLPVEIVSASYFPVLEVGAVRGRVFLPEEDGAAGAHPVVLIGDGLWRHRFGADPGIVGRPIHLDGRPLTVVGVLPAGFRGLTGQAEAWIPMRMAPELRRAVLRLDRDLPVFDVQTLEQRISASTSRLRFGTFLLSLFAAVSCLLAAVGLYGVIASSVAGRTREIGIRVALGASPPQVAGLVMSDGLRLALLGLALGLALALAFARLLSGFLYRLSATDPATFLAAALLLLAVSLIASYVPTRRALQVDPAVALRHE
jgi:putative ABC transport system permease protein